MTKVELINEVAASANVTKKAAADAVAAVFALGEVNLVFEGVLPALLGFLPIAYI